MESKAGAILALIAGIIDLIIFVLLSFFFIVFSGGFPGLSSGPGPIAILFSIFFSALILVFGILLIIASRMMKNTEKVKKWSILCLIIGIFNLLFVVPGILAIIGGAIGLSDDSKSRK